MVWSDYALKNTTIRHPKTVKTGENILTLPKAALSFNPYRLVQ